jgi:hypothetical protein
MKGRSSIVCLEATKELHQQVEQAGIRCTFRNNSLRIAFHTTNTQKDVEAALEVLRYN